MTPDQQTAADNALLEKLAVSENLLRKASARGLMVDAAWLDVFANEIAEAAERIKSLLAEVERLSNEKDELAEHAKEGWGHAHRWRAEYDAAEADRQRMREALEAIERAPAWGYPDKWETTPAEVRQLARAALNPASKEANDG